MSTGPADEAVQRPDTDDMLMIHQSFRREFGLAPALVSATPTDARRRARRVAAHLSLVSTSLHDHHAGEDTVLWPALRATNQVDPATLTDMFGEHRQLTDQLISLHRCRRAWARKPEPGRTRELVDLLTRIHAEVTHHLDHEEEHVLPLVRAHLTVAQWDELAAESRRRLPRSPRRQLLLLGVLLENATPEQRRRVDQQMPAPARLVWHTVGHRYYTHYVRRLRPHTP